MPYISDIIFEDFVREVTVEFSRLNQLVDGTGIADLSGLSSSEVTIVDGINDAYPRYRITQADTIKLPSNCTLNVAEILQIEGIIINDGLILEV